MLQRNGSKKGGHTLLAFFFLGEAMLESGAFFCRFAFFVEALAFFFVGGFFLFRVTPGEGWFPCGLVWLLRVYLFEITVVSSSPELSSSTSTVATKSSINHNIATMDCSAHDPSIDSVLT